jgi:magnesium transporter
MVKTFADKADRGYSWIDIAAPDQPELENIAKEYGLHHSSIQDWLQADHLPKYERLKDYVFIIMRIYDDKNNKEADTVQEVTNKLALFAGEDFLLTLHINDCPLLEHIADRSSPKKDISSIKEVINEIVKAVLLSFDKPAAELSQSIDSYENYVFLKSKHVPILKPVYYIKRKADVIRRILMLSFDIIDRIDASDTSTADTRDTRDLYIKQQSIFDSLSENTNHLLNIYFNISSQKTNETIRVLTIFSVFFMPLTFIVGIYGMNFKVMPELQWAWGYPGVLLLMGLVTIVIYWWFKRKKWL